MLFKTVTVQEGEVDFSVMHAYLADASNQYLQQVIARDKPMRFTHSDGNCYGVFIGAPPGVMLRGVVSKVFSSPMLEEYMYLLTSVRNQVRLDTYVVVGSVICRELPRGVGRAGAKATGLAMSDGDAYPIDVGDVASAQKILVKVLREFEYGALITLLDMKRGLYHGVVLNAKPMVSKELFIAPKPPIPLPWSKTNLLVMFTTGLIAIYILTTHPGLSLGASLLVVSPFLLSVAYPWLKPLINLHGAKNKKTGEAGSKDNAEGEGQR